MFSATFDKQDEDHKVLDEIELYTNFNNNRKSRESDIDNIIVRSQLEQQIQNQETKDSEWRFDKIISMTICFHKIV